MYSGGLNDEDKKIQSKQVRLDYSRYDGGKNAVEITIHLTPQQLHNLMSEFYEPELKVTESQCNAIRLDTIGQASFLCAFTVSFAFLFPTLVHLPLQMLHLEQFW